MISHSIKDTTAIATEFARNLEPRIISDDLNMSDSSLGVGVPDIVRATIVALRGDLGSGKTTFVKAFATVFGINEEEVTSPTFIIEKRFDIRGSAFFKTFIHIDAYRIDKPEEMERLDWKKTLANKENLILVEWPENMGSAMPLYVPTISFTFIDENTRKIVFN